MAVLRFARLREDDLGLILTWRTRPDITSMMISDIELDMDKQRHWLTRISSDPTVRHWMILWNDRPVGVINLADINDQHKRCSAGYYIGDLALRQLGAVIPPYLYNHVFRDLGFNKIYGEVMASNAPALRMHALHGYRQVGTLRKHILKNATFLDMVVVELLAETWLAEPKYRRYVADFER